MKKQLIGAVVSIVVSQGLVGCIGKGRPPIRVTPDAQAAAQGAGPAAAPVAASEEAAGREQVEAPVAQAVLVAPEGMVELHEAADFDAFVAEAKQYNLKAVRMNAKEYAVQCADAACNLLDGETVDADAHRRLAGFVSGIAKKISLSTERSEVILENNATEMLDTYLIGFRLTNKLFVPKADASDAVKNLLQISILSGADAASEIHLVYEKAAPGAEVAAAAPVASEEVEAPAVEPASEEAAE